MYTGSGAGALSTEDSYSNRFGDTLDSDIGREGQAENAGLYQRFWYR
jgi:hypothetical protein